MALEALGDSNKFCHNTTLAIGVCSASATRILSVFFSTASKKMSKEKERK
jgi:hypothetical protein